MARKYDRLIRFYDSWFGDLLDEEKEFTPEECWTIVLAIRNCQREASLEPLQALPKHLRRSLQMRTLETQIEKILEHTSSMASRGQRGGLATALANVKASAEATAQEIDFKAPNDGVERNEAGLRAALDKIGLTESEQHAVLLASNYGQIGHPIWKAVYQSQQTKHPREYFMACIKNMN